MIIISGTITAEGDSWRVVCPTLLYDKTGPDPVRLVDNLFALVLNNIAALPCADPCSVNIRRRPDGFDIVIGDPRYAVALLLRLYRGVVGLTLADVAAAIGSASRGTVGQFESGRHSQGIARVVDLFAALGRDVRIEITDAERVSKG